MVVSVNHAQQQVSLHEAKMVAVENMKVRTAGQTYSLASINNVHVRTNSSQDTLLYEITFADSNAVLLSGHRACFPILGSFRASNVSILDTLSREVPCCLKALVHGYAVQNDMAFENDTITLFHANEWHAWKTGTQDQRAIITMIPPITSTRWGQDRSNDGMDCSAYNYFVNETDNSCVDCEDNKCPIGCTAVAMGQIMRRWHYPVYLPNKFLQYDWCNMPDGLYVSSPNYTKEKYAIARLLKDCAESVNAVYCVAGKCATSATLVSAKNALEDDFGYNSRIDWKLRSSYSLSSWQDLIKSNLNAGMPILYYSPGMHSDAHVFICDGFNDADEFHFNWGWWGNYDANWFTLNDLTPGTHNYSYAQEAVFYIIPDDIVDYCDYSLPLWAHYLIYYDLLGLDYPPPYANVPQTFSRLESVDIRVAQENDFPSSWYTIAYGESSEYVAHNEVILLPGFAAVAGSSFVARIVPCEDCNGETPSIVSLENTGTMIEDLLARAKALKENPQPEKVEPAINGNFANLYPNPSNGSFTIEVNTENFQPYSVEIYSPVGDLVYKNNRINSPKINCNQTSIGHGIYFVKIVMGNRQEVKKIVIQ